MLYVCKQYKKSIWSRSLWGETEAEKGKVCWLDSEKKSLICNVGTTEESMSHIF